MKLGPPLAARAWHAMPLVCLAAHTTSGFNSHTEDLYRVVPLLGKSGSRYRERHGEGPAPKSSPERQ